MALKVDGLAASIDGRTLLDGVSFTIEPGRRLGIVGEAGAGKSLLSRAVLGLLPAGAKRSGAVEITADPRRAAADDFIGPVQPSAARAPDPRIAGLLPHAAEGFDPLLTIGAQVRQILGLDGANANARVAATLRSLDLDPALAARYPRDLAAPSRQLLMAGLVLAQKPQLLVADDPTAGLDVIARRRIIDLIAKHCTERGMSLLLISPDLKAVALLCDSIAVMRGGKIIEIAARDELLGRPRQALTRGIVATGRYRGRTLMRAPIGGALLDVRRLGRTFRGRRGEPVVALDNVSFAIRAGEALALVGPAAAGKSTLIRVVAGLVKADSGEIEFDHEIYHGTDLPPRLRRDIALVSGDPMMSLNPRLTIGESIAEPLRLEALRAVEELSARIIEVLSAVGFGPDVLARRPEAFSAGQRQRLAVGRALITQPRLVLLDDPVGGLDIAARGEVLVLLNRLRADFGTSFVFSTGDLDVMRIVADRVLVMDHGRVVETGTPAQLLEKPAHPVTQRLVAAALPDISIVPVF